MEQPKEIKTERTKKLYNAESFKLSNGLQVIVVKNSLSPAISVGVLYNVGTADDPNEIRGVSHFLEHMMFKGTKKMPGGLFKKAILDRGGQTNAHTGFDRTFYETVLSLEDLEFILEAEADRMVNLTYEEKEVISEKDVVLQERLMRIDNHPFGEAWELYLKAVNPHHPYGSHPIGTPDQIKSYTFKNTRDWYEKWYAPNNAVLIIAGNVDLKTVKPLVEKYFGPLKPCDKIPTERIRPQNPVVQNQTTQFVIQKNKRSSIISILMSYKAPSFRSLENKEEYYAYIIAAYMLGGNKVSMFYNKLVVENNDIADSIDFSFDNGYDPHNLEVSAELSPNMSVSGFSEAFKNYAAEIIQNIDSEDFKTKFENAKKQIIGSLKFANDGTYGIIHGFTSMSEGFSLDDIENTETSIESVKLETIKKVVKKILSAKPEVMMIVTPENYQLKFLDQ